MKDFVVYHMIHVRTPARYISKLFVADVPDTVTVDEIKSLLTRAGYQFGEFRTPWANHFVKVVDDDSPDEVIGAYNRGDVDTVIFSRLQEAAGVTVDERKKRKRQVRDALNKCNESGKIEQIAAILGV